MLMGIDNVPRILIRELWKSATAHVIFLTRDADIDSRACGACRLARCKMGSRTTMAEALVSADLSSSPMVFGERNGSVFELFPGGLDDVSIAC